MLTMKMEVHLAIYDLSNGMARNLSAQFLGSNHVIEMIPHTALLVYGKEYFFGGGIQSVDPHVFRLSRGIQPCQIHKLGVTHRTKEEFENWCDAGGGTKFNNLSYDLLYRNCNNFSHEAALQGLNLTRGVPDWILHVPERFLSSPMGQMIRPILEDMQITQTAPVQASTPSSLPFPSSTSAARNSQPTDAVNPWAESASSITNDRPSVLKKFTNPMLSNDTQSLPLCVKKLSPHLTGISQGDFDDFVNSLQGGENVVSNEIVENVTSSLWQLLKNDTKSCTSSFTLLLLRLVVLRYPDDTKECMEWLASLLTQEDVWKNAMVKSLAWCAVSNYCAAQQKSPIFLVDAAISAWYDESVQVRQAASTYLYNYILSQQQHPTHDNNFDDTIVSILCSALERVTEEQDATTRLRQLVLCGRLVYPICEQKEESVNEIAKELVLDLGFYEMLQHCQRETLATSTATDCQQLAAELARKLQQ